MATRTFQSRLLAAVGAVTVVVGTYLPWLQPHPALPPDAALPRVYITGMIAGIESGDFGLLGLVGATALLHLTTPGGRLRAVGTTLAGGGVVAFCLVYLSTSSLVGFAATFVPAPGWYATVAGGVLLMVSGAAELAQHDHVRPLNRDSKTRTP